MSFVPLARRLRVWPTVPGRLHAGTALVPAPPIRRDELAISRVDG